MRLLLLILFLSLLVIFPSFLYLNYSVIQTPVEPPLSRLEIDNGPVVMPHLKNSTIKAELGQSSWKLLHTMMARFPEHPTQDEKEALRSFIYLFSRLYPCGECATEFQAILAKHPPQVSSRETASQWACAVHNIVNKRLQKEIFDCGKITEKYKCGCDDEKIHKS
ncbi:ERV/ALR sulfhydryl oxidase domain-containing protein [Glomus cerebriforme]|uniref:Sulfhydryl oxidase n=1 Tax=Glomus cerebriforme TaxID=658196 RepID=A0A397S7I7_9GLOM|nr:ERV/ALR sulfhydryl oxidase domain-containing protein [Glomus cerebriforme]